MSTSTFAPGGYRFIPGMFQYSGGVAAEPGFRIERVRFRKPAEHERVPTFQAHHGPSRRPHQEGLAAALDSFSIDVTGRVCLDVGASTGGFTEVLLARGARRVLAVDVGREQLHPRLRHREQVTSIEQTDIRSLDPSCLPEPPDFAAIDVSFISLKLAVPPVGRLLSPSATIIALIKPQFEAGRKQVGKGGIIKDPAVHRQVLTELLDWLNTGSLRPAGLMRSPIKGAEGNIEFLVWLRPGVDMEFDAAAAIDAALA